ncbi:glycosyl transferase family 90 [Methylobacterium gnaphalii]|uniref:glycosyl transferase family 90 n=1 Tax=Methylobacterium gnaphalii TaxID=1010610 RepID=UPI0014786663|nr:glycosyl transferase family 90 [Methylobacterium gnaphalii]
MWQSFGAAARKRKATALERDPAYVEAETRRLLTTFVDGDPRPFSATLSAYFGRPATITYDETERFGRLSFRLRYENDQLEFVFLPQPSLDDVAKCLFERFKGSIALFAALANTRLPLPIDAVFNMNDDGCDDGFAFCANHETFTLIPDNFFLDSRGYADAREHFQARAVAWDDRRDAVVWRGISSGQLVGTNPELPRVALCRMCRADTSGVFDVGLTAIAAQGEADRERIEQLGLMVPPMPWTEFGQYRYHIDIDGHTNSWPGLMLKLLTGGLVFKVDPPFGHRQWFYDRLRPFENYVPVRSDLGDLFELVAYFRSRPELAHEIGRQGQQLALSMTMEAELDYGVRAIIGRQIRDAVRSGAAC